MSIFKEFKEFALKGNVLNLAVGVVIGAAFGKVVSSLVSDIIMPVVGLLTGGISFSDLKLVLKAAHGDNSALTLNYGSFIDTIVNLLIIAASIFVAIKLATKATKMVEQTVSSLDPRAKTPEAGAEATEEKKDKAVDVDDLGDQLDVEKVQLEVLLEIRDYLKRTQPEATKADSSK